jgi:hypothetical protein
MLTVFVIISGENWNEVWAATQLTVGPYCAPFFVALVVMGNYVVLNLFVAILLGGFTDLEPEPEDEPEYEMLQKSAAEDEVVDLEISALNGMRHSPRHSEAGTDDHALGTLQSQPASLNAEAPSGADRPTPVKMTSPIATPPSKRPSRLAAISRSGSAKSSKRTSRAPSPKPSLTGLDADAPASWDEYALGIFSPTNPVRLLALGLVTFDISGTPFSFENAIIMLIIFSSGCMALEDCKLQPHSPFARFLELVNMYATFIFIGEMCLKILAYGCVQITL